jgi:antitoxin (DNA-binding transcriptional repressor) of toxin-antitoxin stability system
MITTVNIPETTDQFTELIHRVQLGEEILLAQNGVAIARLVPIQPLTQPRIPGQDKGKVTIACSYAIATLTSAIAFLPRSQLFC